MIINLKSESPLIQAVFSGNIDEVKVLINNKKADVNYQSPHSRLTSLHIASYCSGGWFKSAFDKTGGKNEDDHEQLESSDDIIENKNANKNYIEIVSLLCKSGARINCKDGNQGLTPLHYACRTNSYEAVEILLDYQADPNSRDKNWQAPLHICAMYNSIECARLLLKHMSNIDLTDRQGRSALAHASFNGKLQMVEHLLNNGANSNMHDKQERRPIHWASYIGYNEIVKLLVENGADVNCLDKELYTPLLVACASGKSEETIKLLIELGADTLATTIYDSTIFHLACLNGHDQIVKELIYTFELKLKTNSKGYHPIHYAAGCKRGDFCLEVLISLGVDVNITSFVDGRTPLHIAALHGRTSCGQVLVSNGAQINVKDADGNTPLHLAASNGQTQMIQFLIDCGANIYICGSDGMLAWALAALNGHSECFRTIFHTIPTISSRKQFYESKDDYGRTFMHLAAISGNYECLNMLINNDCDVNQIDKNGNTPLHYACTGSYLKCVELLINSGAEVNETNECLFDEFKNDKLNECMFTGGYGCTPLMLACAFDQDGYVVRELVLNARARADITDKKGFNTLHYAALQGNRNVFEIILDNCKHLNHQENQFMISPLHILAYHGHRDALEFLIRNVFNVDVKDKNGRTPLDLACFQGESSCVECLLNYGSAYDACDYINERTPVHAAAYNNNLECLKIIASFANSNNNINQNQSSIMDINSDNYCFNPRVADLRDKFGRTPLMIAVEQGHLNTISFLIYNMGADTLAYDKNQRTSLHRSAALGYEESCTVILKANSSALTQRDVNGLLPIHYAVISGHANLISFFFDYHEPMLPENINNENEESENNNCETNKLLDNKGFSLLHFACFNGHSTCIETICDLGDSYPFLIEMLFKPSMTVYSKFSPIHCACFNGHDGCLSYLLDRYNDSVNIFIEIEDSNGNRPLHICALNNDCSCASYLLQANCSVNSKNKFLHTPFMVAVYNNSFTIMELFLSSNTNYKIDLSCTDNKGNSALHLALLNDHENCALFILDHIEVNSQLINLKNINGQTPLHLASTNGWLTCCEILLSKGADIWIRNNKNKTPLLCCAKNDSVADCLDLMLSRLLLMTSTTSSHHHGKLSNNTNAPTNPNMMMMMMMANAMTPTHNNNTPKNKNIQNLTNSGTNVKLNSNDYDTLTTSDIILNDVNMNPLTLSMDANNFHEPNENSNEANNENLVRKNLDTNFQNDENCKQNKLRRNSNSNKIVVTNLVSSTNTEKTNLNSTLLNEDNGLCNGNSASSGGCSGNGSCAGSFESLDTLHGCLNINASEFLKQQSSFDLDFIESVNKQIAPVIENTSTIKQLSNVTSNSQSPCLSSFDSDFF